MKHQEEKSASFGGCVNLSNILFKDCTGMGLVACKLGISAEKNRKNKTEEDWVTLVQNVYLPHNSDTGADVNPPTCFPTSSNVYTNVFIMSVLFNHVTFCVMNFALKRQTASCRVEVRDDKNEAEIDVVIVAT